MSNETRKKWINSEVLKCLNAAHVLLEVATERASAITPGGKRLIMPSDYRNQLIQIKNKISITQAKLSKD